MGENCFLCGKKLEETFLGKPNGSPVKIKEDNSKNKIYYVCSECQSKNGRNFKKEVEKKLGL
ncbi:hypothetical protein HYV49_01370 [Candidatus Pacearchaeota archaeon]|nr:hypothetical protein [Candidatus Pacearchaeota archaeon]